MRLRFMQIVAAVLLSTIPFAAKAADRPASLTVFAAASLTDALGEIGKRYETKSGEKIVFSFAASSVLARQIESSSGVDMFLSADRDWMDYLDKKNLLMPDTRRDLLGNRLVLISPADLNIAVALKAPLDLAKIVGNGRLALADPASVPAGKYGKAALIALGAWDGVANHLAPAENVRVALAYVARGETPLGIVYETDAKIDPRVHIVGVFPESSHPPIVYPAALIKDAKPEARAFLDYLSGPEARAVFIKDGFTVLVRAPVTR